MLKNSDDFINSEEIFKNSNQRERSERNSLKCKTDPGQGRIKNLTQHEGSV